MSVIACAQILVVAGLLLLLQVLDVVRLRLRDKVLALAPFESWIAVENQPQPTTWSGADNALIDSWSARKLGVWWIWRAVFCIFALCAFVVLYTFLKRPGSWVTIAIVFSMGLYPHWSAIQQLKGELHILATSI